MDTPKKIGRYEIVEEKGRGAMGAVYIARDPAMDRIVALKTVHSLALSGPQAAEFRERFYRESRAAGRLAHPGIVQMFDVGDQDELPFLVMEYIEGQTLADAAKGGQRFTLERVCEIGQQIAEALGFAHKHGVIHRDIKPSNILLTSKEKYGIERPKITDFGVAKLTASQITNTGQMLGTPAFMPPEQFTGAPIDGRSDLFSLGVILYWMSTGDQAFPGETITAVSYKVVHTEPVPPRKLNPAVPVALERLIQKCLSKDPAARYQTGEELARELAAVRASREAPELQNHVTMTAAPGSDSGMDVTLDSDVAEVSGVPLGEQSVTKRTGSSKPIPVGPQRKLASILAVAVAVGILVTGLYLRRRRAKWRASQETAAAMVRTTPTPNAQTGGNGSLTETPTGKTSDAQPEAGSLAALVTPASPVRKTSKAAKNADTSKNAGKSTPEEESLKEVVVPVSPVPEPPKPQPASTAPARVDFDPVKLSPNASEKLKIEADHFPTNINFTIEMNGMLYFERRGRTQTVFENLFVPPGVWEFRVVVGQGPTRKLSNIVSMEFKAKKHKTLRIELRAPGQTAGSPVPKDISSDSQLILTLK
jgi:serine/threonine protein kinase